MELWLTERDGSAIIRSKMFLSHRGNYEEAISNKENIDKEIVRRWVNKALQKRELDEKTWQPEFWKNDAVLLNTLEELEETENGSKKKILELAMNDDEYITKFWESVRTERCKSVELKDEKLRIKINLLLVGVVVHLSLRAILFAQKGVVFRFLPDSGGLAEDKRSSLFQMMISSHFERLSKQQSSIFENYA
ncbi:11368_t:CDS:2 [Acaulospora morrowiae]|uniref:11368_t:CDS:1 n=1 Tax=Acaulospora morrowiae TaxID=94023 RepID=A0A9N8ZQ75_9GLOM|nr:11368_t:CDS:2 [Acaulospora morrowiae]